VFRGRTKEWKKTKALNFPNTNHFPLFIYQYFENIINVEGYIHCRFRAVSGLIGDSVDSYNMVHLYLSIELKQKKKDI
jgi:hypothetical protein